VQSINTNRWTLGFIALLLVLILVACTSDTQRIRESNGAARLAQTPATPTPFLTATPTAIPAPTSTPTLTPTPAATLAISIPATSATSSTPTKPPDTGEDIVRVLAPIDGVDLVFIESAHPRYSLVVRSLLPNGCARFEGYTVYGLGRAVYVMVTNVVSRDQPCTEVYDTVETRIPLSSELEQGIDYSARVSSGYVVVIDEDGSPIEALDEDPPPALNRPFHIQVNQLALIEPEALEIRFEAVLKDHRCIPVVECYVPEVRAEVLISAVDTSSGEEFRLRLVLADVNDDPITSSFGPYSIALVELSPQPNGVRTIDASEYSAVLLVSGPIDESPVSYEQVRVALRGSPVEGKPLTMRFYVDITGMASNTGDLYCQPEIWEFGDDGTDHTDLLECGDWQISIDILSKHFERTYTYEAAGDYAVSLTYGPLAPETITIQVK